MRYALQTVLAGALFLWLRPWRYYAAPRFATWGPATLVGTIVFALWVLPETGDFQGASSWREWYGRYAIRPFGALPAVTVSSPFAPSACGWPLTIARLTGSALVIAPIEEFFWRGFLYRWMIRPNFTKVEPAPIRWGAFWATALVFGFEHDRWLAGLLAGAIYGWLYARTRDVWAAVWSHVITNLLLGLYVIGVSAYTFW